MDNKKENYQSATDKAVEQAAKGVAAQKAAKVIAALIIVVPILIIFALFFFLGIKTRAFFNWSSNVRGIIIFFVIAVPVFAGSLIYPKLKTYFEERILE